MIPALDAFNRTAYVLEEQIVKQCYGQGRDRQTRADQDGNSVDPDVSGHQDSNALAIQGIVSKRHFRCCRGQMRWYSLWQFRTMRNVNPCEE